MVRATNGKNERATNRLREEKASGLFARSLFRFSARIESLGPALAGGPTFAEQSGHSSPLGDDSLTCAAHVSMLRTCRR